MSTVDTDAAFPLMVDARNNNYAQGLTKREYIATQVMAGIAAAGFPDHTVKGNAEAAVEWADALIQALNESK